MVASVGTTHPSVPAPKKYTDHRLASTHASRTNPHPSHTHHGRFTARGVRLQWRVHRKVNATRIPRLINVQMDKLSNADSANLPDFGCADVRRVGSSDAQSLIMANCASPRAVIASLTLIKGALPTTSYPTDGGSASPGSMRHGWSHSRLNMVPTLPGRRVPKR